MCKTSYHDYSHYHFRWTITFVIVCAWLTFESVLFRFYSLNYTFFVIVKSGIFRPTTWIFLCNSAHQFVMVETALSSNYAIVCAKDASNFANPILSAVYSCIRFYIWCKFNVRKLSLTLTHREWTQITQLKYRLYGPRRIRDMRTIATDDPVAWCVCQSVSVSGWHAPASCKTAEDFQGHTGTLRQMEVSIAASWGGKRKWKYFARCVVRGCFDAAIAKFLCPLVLMKKLQ